MGIVRTGETDYEKELAKWEKPYRYERFPAMLYKAIKGPETNGGIVVLSFEGQHDQRTSKKVNNEREEAEALANGWHKDPQAAYNAMAKRDEQHADDATVVAYEASKMGTKAKREYKKRSAATDKHLVE